VFKIKAKLLTPWRLFFIFLLAFSIRLAMNIMFQGINAPPDPDMGPDHVQYDILAQNLASGKGYTIGGAPSTSRPPGTSFLLAIIYYFFGVNYVLARIMFCLLGALTCIVTYFIGKNLKNDTVGFLAAITLAVYPMHFYYSMHMFSEIP
jgi:4-amino-4-deoxy-L-arabinose transferase-like glycosyltransferase